MEVLHNLALGFGIALTWQNLLYCAIGCTVGTLVGLLPGLGPLATISILLPLTYSIPTGGALIMLAGIYYGAQYGDSVSAITMKIPHASSIVACIDGYQMTLNGKTGLALFTAGVSSFIGGTVAIVVLSFFAPMLGEVAFLFGPADYCALMLVGFVCVSFVTTGSLLNGLAMCLIGVLLGQIGTDVNSGAQRFTMDMPFLTDGVGLVSIALGCFGIAEITKNLDKNVERTPFNGKIKLMPTWAEFKRIIPSALRGSAIGSFMGILPGGGPVIAQFAAYAVDKKFSKYKHELGHGAIEGVAGQAAAAHEHRHSRERRDGPHDGSLHHQGHPARTEHDRRPPRPVLGPGRQHVGGQRIPDHAQRAPGALLAVCLQDSLQRAVSFDSFLRLHRHLQRQQQPG
jgi:TctA family transporter